MKSSLFKRVVVPAMGVEGTTVLAISTPDDEFNYFSELFELKRKDGTSLFYLIMVGLACKACMEMGVGHECVHMLADQPPWKSAERQEQMKLILSGDTDAHLRENMGMIKGSSNNIYQQDWIKNFIQRQLYKITVPPDIIYTYIDPHGGGSMSDCAVSSMLFENGKEIVIGADRTDTSDDELIIKMMTGHIMQLRGNAYFKNSLIVLSWEANMGWDRGSRCNKIFSDPKYQPLRMQTYQPTGAKELKFGVWTTPQRKMDGAEHLKRALMNGTIQYADQFISREPQKVKHLIADQMRHYRKEVKAPVDELFGQFKQVYGGKAAGGRKDDVVMTLQQGILNGHELRSNEAFTNECASLGWRV